MCVKYFINYFLDFGIYLYVTSDTQIKGELMYTEETYKPIDNMVFVKLDSFVDMNKMGIVLPEQVAEKVERMATVLEVGRGYNTIAGLVPCNVVPGDRVLVHKSSISPLESLDSDTYGVMKDAHIMGIIATPVKKPFIRVEKTPSKK